MNDTPSHPKTTPAAQFRYGGKLVCMGQDQFLDAIGKGITCACGQCLNCRALEYAQDAYEDAAREGQVDNLPDWFREIMEVRK